MRTYTHTQFTSQKEATSSLSCSIVWPPPTWPHANIHRTIACPTQTMASLEAYVLMDGVAVAFHFLDATWHKVSLLSLLSRIAAALTGRPCLASVPQGEQCGEQHQLLQPPKRHEERANFAAFCGAGLKVRGACRRARLRGMSPLAPHGIREHLERVYKLLELQRCVGRAVHVRVQCPGSTPKRLADLILARIRRHSKNSRRLGAKRPACGNASRRSRPQSIVHATRRRRTHAARHPCDGAGQHKCKQANRWRHAGGASPCDDCRVGGKCKTCNGHASII